MVALLAEGVDRNASITEIDTSKAMSPSSRRAWIEILISYTKISPNRVALLAEGVDRNLSNSPAHKFQFGRPPRGGRG